MRFTVKTDNVYIAMKNVMNVKINQIIVNRVKKISFFSPTLVQKTVLQHIIKIKEVDLAKLVMLLAILVSAQIPLIVSLALMVYTI